MRNLSDETRAHADALRTVAIRNRGVRSRRVAATLLGITLLGMFAMGYVVVAPEQLSLATQYSAAKGWTGLMAETSFNAPVHVKINGVTYQTDMQTLAAYPYARQQAIHVALRLLLGGGLGFALGGIGLLLTERYRRRQQKERSDERLVTGMQIVSEKTLAKLTFPNTAPASTIRLGSISIPRNFETQHIAVIGATGSGKTTALRQILDAADARGDAVIVFDTSGFIPHYYDPERGDVILNPFDKRSAFWSPFDEISHPADASRIAEYLVPESGDHSRDVWLETTRGLVANILRVLSQQNKGTLPDLLNAIQNMSSEDIAHLVAGTSSARTFAQDADKATGSVMFMLAKTANLLMFLRAKPRDGGECFSFARFFAELDTKKGKKPWVFIPRSEAHFEAIKPLMACWLDCAASAALSLSPSQKRRVFLVLDEFPDLPRAVNISRLMAQGRKFGAASVIAFQAIGQMRARYGREAAEALLGNCNSKLLLQMSDHDTRQWASDVIGNCEVEITSLADAIDPKTHDIRKSLSRARQTRPVVLESEFRLLHHQGYLLLPGFPVAKITLTDDHIRTRGPAKQPDYVPGDVSETLWGQQSATGQNPQDASAIFATPGPV